MTHHWNNGYRTDVLYTFGYYKELSPTLQRLAVLLAGYETVPVSQDGVHMELGFGQGVSINIHAAAQSGRYIGNDFNPHHVFFAQNLAQAAGNMIDLSDASFAELDAREDLPQCDSISFHGIWSWINDENRQHIVNIIKRCLKPGGIVYNSYNCATGHMAFVPWRDMMYRHFEQQSGSSMERLNATIEHFKEVFEKNPNLLEHNAVLKTSWNRMLNNDRHYILHEYFNSSWDSFTLVQVLEQMAAAKLQFVGTTTVNNHTNRLSLSDDNLQQVQAQPSVVQAEMWRDILLNNTFRQDLYVKGGRHLSDAQVLQRLQQWSFVCTVEGDTWTNFLYSQQDSRHFNNDLFDPIKTVLLQENGSPKTFKQLQAAVPEHYNWGHVLQVVLLKIQAGQLQPCMTAISDTTRERCLRLNAALLQQLDETLTNVYVASPVTGMGLQLDFVFAWCLRVLLDDGRASDQHLADTIWQCLESHQRVLLDAEGNSLSGKQANIDYLLQQQIPKMRARIPVWQALGLLPAVLS